MAARPNLIHILAITSLIFIFSITTLQAGIAHDLLASSNAPLAPALAPSLWATPLDLDFGPIGIGETSDPQAVKITNTGNATLANFSQSGVSAPFHSTNNCAVGVLPGSSCQYSFWYEPTNSTSTEATVEISTNAGPVSIHLRGKGIGAELSVSPLALDFGTVTAVSDVSEDLTADQQIVFVSNTGVADLTGFSGGEVAAPFTVASDCPSSLPPGEQCPIYYNFFPTTAGEYNATSTFNTNAGSFTIKLTGKGQSSNIFSGQRATPLELDFGPIGIGYTSDPQVVTVTNLDLTKGINNFAASSQVAPFDISTNCDQNVDPGGSCNYTFRFSPTQIGIFEATTTITNSIGMFSVKLHGTGIGAEFSVSPLMLDFGPVATGMTSDPQYVNIKNTGITTLTGIVAADVKPPFSGSQNCDQGLLPGESCQYTFYFSPIVGGQYISTTTTTTNAGMFTITLIGGVIPPQIEKGFEPNLIAPGGATSLQLNIDNPNLSATAFDVQLSDNFPAGMVVATPLTYSVSPECGTPTFSPVVGQAAISVSDATILGGDTCQIHVNITHPLIGKYTNTTNSINSRDGMGNKASATLTVGYFNYLPYTPR